MTCMRARRSSKFGAIRPPTAELHVAALERRKNLYRLIMGKTVLPLFLSCFDQIIFILAVKDDIHNLSRKSSNFRQTGAPTTELSALESLYNTPIDL